MAKLKLQPDPTFKATVLIPAAGMPDVSLEFTFKHRTRDQLRKFVEESAERGDDAETILEMATGWELADAFNKENVTLLVQNYTTAGRCVFDKYLDELARARVKN
jgi:hypothetical protein